MLTGGSKICHFTDVLLADHLQPPSHLIGFRQWILRFLSFQLNSYPFISKVFSSHKIFLLTTFQMNSNSKALPSCSALQKHRETKNNELWSLKIRIPDFISRQTCLNICDIVKTEIDATVKLDFTFSFNIMTLSKILSL